MTVVKVKPLDWVAQTFRSAAYQEAATQFNDEYTIWETQSGEWRMKFGNAMGVRHGTEQDAKAAAQADYERRILAAIHQGDDQ